MSELLFEQPVPPHGEVKIKRDADAWRGSMESIPNRGELIASIIQSGGEFRAHVDDSAVTLDPLDALWIIETLKMAAHPSGIMRRVVIWKL